MKLHIGVNDRFLEIFINNAKESSNLSDHHFLIYGNPELPFSDNFSFENLTFVDKLNHSDDIIDKINQSTVIYIHFLSEEVSLFLSTFDLSNKKLVWIFWGTDGFSLPEISKQLKDPARSIFYNLAKDVRDYFFKRKSKSAKYLILPKINYFAHYIDEDFEMMRSLLAEDVQFLNFSYGVNESIIIDKPLLGDDILVGNSASITNYHLFAFNKIEAGHSTSKIHCPLSYGGQPDYVNQMIAEGKKRFGTRFIPYTEKMKSAAFHNIVLSQAKFAFMCNNRSQAWGNIMQLLWQGSSVLMLKQNNLFKFLKRNGFHVFDAEKEKFISLSQNQMIENRQKLNQLFSLNAMKDNYNLLLSI